MAQRLAMLEDQYKILTDLELELINIMEKGNIIAYEKGCQAKNSTGNPLNNGNSQKATQMDQAQSSPCKIVQC